MAYSEHSWIELPNTEQEDDDSDKETGNSEAAMIKVTNIPNGTSKYALEFFFENRRSGGGPIDHFEYDPDTKSAVITFEEPEAVKRVIGKIPILFNGVQIGVEEFHLDVKVDDFSEETGEDSENILEVRGVSSRTSEDTVMMFFENTRRSGGGEIKSMKSEDGVFYIIFEDECTIEKVLKKQHKIDGTAIKVCRYVPPPPPKPVPVYSNKVFITNIYVITTKSELENFLEDKTNVTPVSIEIGELEGAAVVTFEEDIDFEKLQLACKMSNLDKYHLKISRVPITNCAIVRNISENTSLDTLEFYFDNEKRSGVSGVMDVKMLDGFCLVYFEEPEAVDVVCRRSHRVDRHDLDVKMYYECLVKPFKLPAPLVISDSDPKKLHFLIKSQSKLQALETQLKAVYGKPIWPKETIASSFTVKCTLTPETKDCRKLARTWEANVKESITTFFNQLNAEPDSSDLAMFQHYIECQTCGSYSEFYCNACHQRMCGNCRNEHLKNPDNNKHEVCNYKERKLKLSSIPCKLHPSQLLALCCKKCQQAICALCTTKEHEGHGFLDLEEVYTKHHQMRLDQIRRIRDDIIPQCRVRLKEAMNARDETKESVELMKSIMKVQAFKIKELVDAILAENEQNLQRFESSAVQKLENKETALNIYITQMQTLLECHNQSISCANPVEFLSKMNETPIVDFDPVPEISKISPLVFTDGKLNKDEIRKQFGALSK